jgi:hypothetical protein
VLPDLSGFYFLEMNTRLQVEHPVTECVTGLDLVGLQIDVARGEPCPTRCPPARPRHRGPAQRRGPRRGLPPQRGRSSASTSPPGPGVRVDSGFVAGDVVPGEFDSMLAKVIAVGPTRDEALARLEEALARSTVAIEGGASNRCLLLELVAHDAFRDARVTTRWLDRHLAAPAAPTPPAATSTAPSSPPPSASTSAPAPTRSPRCCHAHRGLPTPCPRRARTVRFAVGGASSPWRCSPSGPTATASPARATGGGHLPAPPGPAPRCSPSAAAASRGEVVTPTACTSRSTASPTASRAPRTAAWWRPCPRR